MHPVIFAPSLLFGFIFFCALFSARHISKRRPQPATAYAVLWWICAATTLTFCCLTVPTFSYLYGQRFDVLPIALIVPLFFLFYPAFPAAVATSVLQPIHRQRAVQIGIFLIMYAVVVWCMWSCWSWFLQTSPMREQREREFQRELAEIEAQRHED